MQSSGVRQKSTLRHSDFMLIGIDIGDALYDICDMTVRVHERETYKIQELHLPVYHARKLFINNKKGQR